MAPNPETSATENIEPVVKSFDKESNVPADPLNDNVPAVLLGTISIVVPILTVDAKLTSS